MLKSTMAANLDGYCFKKDGVYLFLAIQFEPLFLLICWYYKGLISSFAREIKRFQERQ